MRASLRVVVTLLVVAAAVLAGIWLWRYYMLSPWTRDARVRADVVVVAPDVSGWVTDLEVKDNQVVKVGDVLMRIDQERYQANLEQARAVAETRHQQYLLRQNEAARRSRLGIGAISAAHACRLSIRPPPARALVDRFRAAPPPAACRSCARPCRQSRIASPGRRRNRPLRASAASATAHGPRPSHSRGLPTG